MLATESYLEEIKLKASDDELLKQLQERITAGWLNSKKLKLMDKGEIVKIDSCLKWTLVYQNRIIILVCMRKEKISKLHKDHLGME